MSKELTPLEALKRIRQETCPATYNPDFDKNECCDIIETALKRLDYIENTTTSVLRQDISNKLKALEIIKEKQVNCYDIINSVDYKHYLVLMKEYDKSWLLTQEEYELLKEVLL